MSDAHEGDVDSVPSIDVEWLREHVAAGDVFLLDLRRTVHGSQVYGAIRYDPGKLRSAEKLILPLPKDDGLIVLYDEDGLSGTLRALAAKLRENGYGSVHVLDGGYKAWKAADGRIEDATLEQPVPPTSTT